MAQLKVKQKVADLLAKGEKGGIGGPQSWVGQAVTTPVCPDSRPGKKHHFQKY